MMNQAKSRAESDHSIQQKRKNRSLACQRTRTRSSLLFALLGVDSHLHPPTNKDKDKDKVLAHSDT